MPSATHLKERNKVCPLWIIRCVLLQAQEELREELGVMLQCADNLHVVEQCQAAQGGICGVIQGSA